VEASLTKQQVVAAANLGLLMLNEVILQAHLLNGRKGLRLS
jgi:hypothetical protein